MKLDSVTRKPLEGVEFKVTYDDGSYVPDEGGKLSSNGLYRTDKNGEILISDIVGIPGRHGNQDHPRLCDR